LEDLNFVDVKGPHSDEDLIDLAKDSMYPTFTSKIIISKTDSTEVRIEASLAGDAKGGENGESVL
jgi:hypothetical protein